MDLLVTGRLMTKVGTVYMKTAKGLADEAYRARLSNKYQIINGFILRANGRLSSPSGSDKDKGSYVSSVMDTPGYIFFSGSLRLPDRGQFFGLSAPVGIRDDFEFPGTKSTFECYKNTQYYSFVPPSMLRPSDYPAALFWNPFPVQASWLLGYSRMVAPLKKTGILTIVSFDDEEYFDYSCIVGLTGSITSLFTGARAIRFTEGEPEYGSLNTSYFFRNQFAIDEDDLPSNWKLFTRRLLPLDVTGGFSRIPTHIMINGFSIILANTGTELTGTDRYCHAARTFRQDPRTWGFNVDTEFDIQGEQGLLIAIGEQDRSEYDPETGNNVFAKIASLRVFRPQDIEQAYLHPDPEYIPENPLVNKPSLPNFGSFINPLPTPAGDGFVVFSNYTTFLGKGDVSHSGDAWSIITVLPNGRCISLRADWDTAIQTIPTGVPGEFMRPWIVGATSIVNEDTTTGYCLVWEQTYTSGTVLPLKGEWALYSTSGDTPVRRTISGYAPIFSAIQFDAKRFVNFERSEFELDQPLSAISYAGANKIVTSCIDYPPPEDVRVFKCAIFDAVEESIEVVGDICESTDNYEKCIITVVQPFFYAPASSELTPAVLIASVAVHRVEARGKGGKLFISVDGGKNWREYITDAGAQGGAFYVGNKLWRYDVNARLDGRARK
ncbi:hypothetical protein LCG56_26965 [Pseudomonas cannabina pv. alisalensis]|uniref:Uncharacterized protein n=1 Tax=Pseudomonas syringae pv. maculicola str. ES4326 TaxID=629265 RepID=A0A8T8C024_PSEYM|nr:MULTISPECIES: hypothetical protein [Pseudomonas syringae group]QHE96869.1 hypothetical protein PMA4326_009685 [Pseudomonas syringae pv. maculicola str. ES4326]UBY97528.1 hypothetical protein LCG56_26965 [Pseudomonas cannabina pv. alisalensis]